MCIIIAKKKGDRLPTIDELKTCYKNNSDGAGFMYTKNGKVVIDKGYMTERAFINRFKHLCDRFDDFKDKALVIHCRIGTAGTNTAQNTHPYPISNSIKKLHKTYTTASIGIAHNGIIHDYNPIDKANDTNDTQEFISNFLAPLYNRWHNFYKSEYIIDAIDRLTGSKFAILTKDDEVILIGDFFKEDGLSFSNTTYIASRYDYYNYPYKWNDWYYDYKEEKTEQLDLSKLIDIPANYFIEYDDKWVDASERYYCINIDNNNLYVYNEDTNQYDFLSCDFTIYNDEFIPMEDYNGWL